MLKKRRMLLSLGAAALVTGPLALTRASSGPRAGPAADLLLLGRRAQRAREDDDARPVRQGEEDRDRARLADQLRQDQGDGRGRRAGMGSGRRRRPLHLPGQGPARDARHEPHPERQERSIRAGSRAAASSPRPARRSIAWNTKAFPEDKGPTSWKDFWDVKAFPGPRGLYKPLYYNYEAALLAAGTPRNQIYPGHRRQGQARVRQAARDQAAREGVVDRRRAAAAAAVERRARAVLGVDGPHPRGHEGKGAGRDDLRRRHRLGQRLGRARRARRTPSSRWRRSTTRSPRKRRCACSMSAPTARRWAAAAAKATPEQQKILVTAPENARKMLIINEEQAALYSAKYEAEWNRFQLG